MSWDDLRYILAVSRHGTLQAAADALAVNATTVSRRVKALEEQSGTALFEKLKHGVVFTEAGQAMIEAATAMEELAHDLDARVRGLDARLEGVVRVASTDMLLELWAEDFAAFQATYPGVDVELLSSYQMVNLTRREADIAVRLATKAPDHLIGRRHAEAFYAIYGSHDLVGRIGADAPYTAYPWVSWDPRVTRATDRTIERVAKGARIALRIDTIPLLRDVVRAGVGLSVLPCLVGDRDARLTRVGDYFEGGLYLWVLTHPELRGTARVRACVEHVRALVARDRALIEGRTPRI